MGHPPQQRNSIGSVFDANFGISDLLIVLVVALCMVISISIPVWCKLKRERILQQAYENWVRARKEVKALEGDMADIFSDEGQRRVLAELGALGQLKAHRDLFKHEWQREAVLIEMYDGIYVSRMPER